MSDYQAGETVRLKVTITDSGGVVATPATVKISINKPAKVADIVDAIMSNPSTGLYYYDYLIPAVITGTYSWRVVATGVSSRITIAKKTFSVELPL